MSSEVPAATHPLGELVELLSGFPFKSEAFSTDAGEGTPLIRIRDIKTHTPSCSFIGEYDAAYLIDDGDIIIGMDGEFTAVRWQGVPALLNQRVLKIRSSRPDLVDDGYLFHRIQSDLAHLETVISGTTVKHLSVKDIRRLEWLLPPLDEQRRIAEVLRSVDQTIEAQDKVRRQLSAAFSSTLEACFTAAEWPTHPLGDLCESIQVGIVVRPASYYVDSGGIPALRSLNVLENRLSLGDLVHISEAGHAANQKSNLRAGDVVTRRTGEPGKTAMIPAGFEGGLNCIDIIFSRPKDHLRSAYLSFFMNSDAAKRQVAGLQGGLAQQHLNVGEMKKLLLPLPDLQTQGRTVEVLDDMWSSMEASRHVLAKLSALKGGLAFDLLSARFRVPA